MLKGHGFTPDPDDHQYGALGICWKLSPEIGEGSYWTYGQKDLYNIKIHNFSFHKDSLLEFPLPECLSITRYDSISGEELAPYRLGFFYFSALFRSIQAYCFCRPSTGPPPLRECTFEILQIDYRTYIRNLQDPIHGKILGGEAGISRSAWAIGETLRIAHRERLTVCTAQPVSLISYIPMDSFFIRSFPLSAILPN